MRWRQASPSPGDSDGKGLCFSDASSQEAQVVTWALALLCFVATQ